MKCYNCLDKQKLKEVIEQIRKKLLEQNDEGIHYQEGVEDFENELYYLLTVKE